MTDDIPFVSDRSAVMISDQPTTEVPRFEDEEYKGAYLTGPRCALSVFQYKFLLDHPRKYSLSTSCHSPPKTGVTGRLRVWGGICIGQGPCACLQVGRRTHSLEALLLYDIL